MNTIDLHVHSSYSDGTCSPTDLVSLASNLSLLAFALTDHDTMDGIPEALQAASQIPGAPEIIPGIELSTDYHGKDIHIVGLDLPYHSDALQDFLAEQRKKRLQRNHRMIDKMAADGIPISYQKMADLFGEQVWTRAHFAHFLMSIHLVPTMRDAFDAYVGEDCRYFIPSEKISPAEAVSVIRKFGGIPILAHPLQYHFSESDLRLLLRQLKSSGLIAMEIYYSSYHETDVQFLTALADEYGILPSGGSDFHGEHKPHISLGCGCGDLHIPYKILKQLRTANGTVWKGDET